MANNDKLDKLKDLLASYGGVVVAYSGGVDSALLAKLADDALGDRALAVTACSETYPDSEVQEAISLAKRLGIRHMLIKTDEMTSERFTANPPDRCYFCKGELFHKLLEIAREHGLPHVLDGSNYDDQFDHRPGMRAAQELGIRSPLKEAGLSKDDIRLVSREIGLPTWNKPSLACLSSRFPYGEQITGEKLKMVAAAEDYLRSMGIGQMRVRHHGRIARIEVLSGDFPRIMGAAAEISRRLQELGYAYVTLDLAGYRMGSMNETLKAEAAGTAAALPDALE